MLSSPGLYPIERLNIWVPIRCSVISCVSPSRYCSQTYSRNLGRNSDLQNPLLPATRCASCHSGRESSSSRDTDLSTDPTTELSPKLSIGGISSTMTPVSFCERESESVALSDPVRSRSGL